MKDRYIPLQEAAERLGMARGTLFYHLERLSIKPEKFPMDKRKYILESDYERIRRLRDEAIERKESTKESPAVKKPEAA